MAQQDFLTNPITVVSAAITDADTNTTVQALDIPAGAFVPPYGVSVQVVTAFSGGTPALDVGDGDNDDGWVDKDDITEGTPGTYSGTNSNGATYANAGRYYSSADTLDVAVSASLSAGCAYVIMTYYDLSDMDLSAV